MLPMIARGSGYVRGNRDAARARLTSHFKYIEHRSREPCESRDDRRIFTKESNDVPRRDAANMVMSHTSTSVNYHKIVLSPSSEEPVHDWQEWTRQVLNNLEEAQGKELHWYAVHHQNTEHSHVHVVLAGAGYNQETNREEPIKLYSKDYAVLREAGHEHSDYHFQQLLKEQFQELDTLDQMVERDPSPLAPNHDPFHPFQEDFER